MALSIGTSAQTFPQKEIIIINPSSTGSATWVISSMIANAISAKIKMRIVDKPGADKMIGSNFSADAAPDGYTIHIGTTSDMFILPVLKPKGIKYDENSFIPVASIATQDPFLIVPANSPANNLKEYLDMIRQDPNARSFAVAGPLTKILAARVFQLAGTDIQVNEIPYAGDNKIIVDLAGGHLSAGLSTLTTAKPALTSGKIKLIASFGKSRSLEFPNVKTINEQYPGLLESWWWGFYVPAGTPVDIVNFLNESVNAVLNDPKLIEELASNGYTANPMTLSQVTKHHQIMMKKYTPFVDKYLR